MLGSSPVVDLLGMGAGHAYYFLEDVYPRMTGRRPLKTPSVIKALFPTENIQPVARPVVGGGGRGDDNNNIWQQVERQDRGDAVDGRPHQE